MINLAKHSKASKDYKMFYIIGAIVVLAVILGLVIRSLTVDTEKAGMAFFLIDQAMGPENSYSIYIDESLAENHEFKFIGADSREYDLLAVTLLSPNTPRYDSDGGAVSNVKGTGTAVADGLESLGVQQQPDTCNGNISCPKPAHTETMQAGEFQLSD